MPCRNRVVFAILAMVCAAVLLCIIVGAKSTSRAADDMVHCYIVVEPERDWYYYGETITLTAVIEYMTESGNAATPTDLKYNGVWEIVWQRNDHGGDDEYWYDVGEGWKYQFELDHENALSWWRFVATSVENE